MANPKVIIVAGSDHCLSATDGKSWADYLQDHVQPEQFINLSEPKLSNDIISRKAIITTMEMIKQYDRKDILVCVMWNSMQSLDCYNDELDKKILSNLDQYLKTEWFFKKIGVKFFLANSTVDCRAESYKMDDRLDIGKYRKLIDYTFYLQCASMVTWCHWRRYAIDPETKNVSSIAHKEFTDKFVMDFLKFHGYIDRQ